MKILAIDTATEACSVALLWDGQIQEYFVERPREHGALLLGMMEQILREAGATLKDLNAVAFGCGPGSFTGVRIATSVAQAISFGVELPAIPLSNLAILSQGLYREQGKSHTIAALDARMGEVYIGAYEIIEGVATAVSDEQVTQPASVVLSLEGEYWYGAGRGWLAYESILLTNLKHHVKSVFTEQLCHAQDLLPLAIAILSTGKIARTEQILPVYLRNKVAWKSATTAFQA